MKGKALERKIKDKVMATAEIKAEQEIVEAVITDIDNAVENTEDDDIKEAPSVYISRDNKQSVVNTEIKKKRSLLFPVFSVFIIAAFIVSVILIASKLGHYSVNRITQHSMEPTLMSGDILLMEKCSIEDVQEGDIITYRSSINGNTVDITHRVVAKYELIENDGLITDNIVTDELRRQGYVGVLALKTQGDNNDAVDDGYVTKDLIEGRIVYDLGSQTKIIVILSLTVVISFCLLNILLAIASRGKKQ